MARERLTGANPPSPRLLVAVALLVDGALLAADIAFSTFNVPPSAYGAVPLLTIFAGSVTATAAVAVVAWALLAGTAAWHDENVTTDDWVRRGIGASLGLIAILITLYRQRLTRSISHLEHLEEFSGMVEGRLTLADTGSKLCELLVPRVGDLATIDVSVREGELRRLAACSSGAGGNKAATRLGEEPGLPRQAATGVRAAIEWGDTLLVEQVGEQRSSDSGAVSAPVPGTLDPDGIPVLTSYLVVPLRSRGRVLGALTVATTGRRRLDSRELALAQSLASRAAIALDNAGLWAELLAAERQLVEALDGLVDAVTIHDENGTPTYVNQAAADFVGANDPNELMARAGSFRELLDMRHEDGRPVLADELPGRRVFETGRAQALIVSTTHPETAAQRWSRIQATPLHDSDGTIAAAVNIVQDITAEKREQITQRFLANAAEILGSTLDYEAALQSVAERAVPELADWCAIELMDERGQVEMVAVAHRDPAKVRLARQMRERYPVDMSRDDGIAGVLKGAGTQLVEKVTDETLVATARDSSHLKLMRDIGFQSVLIAPMRFGPRISGAITMVNTETRRPFTEADRLLAEALARKAATAVENARLYLERGKIAATLQQGLLPPTLPEVPGFALASVYRAAGDANEVGGDFYDVVPLSDGGWLAVIGDVAGKGAEAAALTARARHTIVSITSVTSDPAEAFARLDDSLRTQTDRGLVSAGVLILNEDRVLIARAGHPPPLLVRGGVPEPIGEAGPLLGLGASHTAWEVVELELLPEDAFVLYTDGVLDTVGTEERFGERRLMAAVAGDAGGQGPEAMAAGLERALEAFQEGPQRDDVAILIVQRLPVGAATGWPAARVSPASATG